MALLAAGFAPITTVQLPNFKPQQRSKCFIISAGPKRSTLSGGRGAQTNSLSIFEESKIVISSTETKKNYKKGKAKEEVNEDEANKSG
ncbi:hypothetical protein L6164_022679 [Bauhinia variegata]|uniref:Uncharacterized protein n=1 Tax=Bauhinia variegata TaxID=167791 RepID=A0ACB9MIV3_BAUVA|nr:hypothetical protein L6164_022679 [Bauhinia variegata]